MGDGAYGGEPVRKQWFLRTRPQSVQTLATRSESSISQTIAQQGRSAWHQKTGYNLRSHVEFVMQCYKRIVGNTMKAHRLPQQKTEAWTSASALLNRMANLGSLCP